MAGSDQASLDRMPVELGFEVLSYLMSPLDPCSENRKTQPLLALAATSKAMRSLVETFCQREMQRMSRTGTDFTRNLKFTLANDAPITSKRHKSYRMIWLKFGRKCCAFCGNKSDRVSMFNAKLKCCANCERRRWPEKITMTKAIHKTKFTKAMLFPPPESVRPPFFRLRYGVTAVMGVPTTMFFVRDLDRLLEICKQLPSGELQRLKSNPKDAFPVLQGNKWRWFPKQEAKYIVIDD